MSRRVAASNGSTEPRSVSSITESRWDVVRNSMGPNGPHLNAQPDPQAESQQRNAVQRQSMAHVVNTARQTIKKDLSHLFSNVKKDVENASTGRLVVWILLVYALGLIVFFFWVPNAPKTFGVEPAKANYADGFYYWATLTSTVGFGDICPKTVGAKIATGLYQVIMVLIGAGAVALIADKKMKKYFKLLDLREKFSRNSVSQ